MIISSVSLLSQQSVMEWKHKGSLPVHMNSLHIVRIGNTVYCGGGPRCSAELTEDDRRRLTNQGVPEHCCDDLSTVRARCSLDKGVNIVGVEVSGPEKMLSRDYILKQIASLMNNTTKPGGMHS